MPVPTLALSPGPIVAASLARRSQPASCVVGALRRPCLAGQALKLDSHSRRRASVELIGAHALGDRRRHARPHLHAFTGVLALEVTRHVVQLRQDRAAVVGHQQLHALQLSAERALDPLPQLLAALAGERGHEHGIAVGGGHRPAVVVVQLVHLVQHEQRRLVAGADLVQHLVHRAHHLLQLLLGHRGVRDVQDQVGVHGLLERRLERLHQLVGQLADEPDRVRHQVVAPLVPVRARRRVERVEQPFPHAHVGVGERVQQRRLARVRVSGQRDARGVRLVAALAHHAPVALGLLEAPLQL